MNQPPQTSQPRDAGRFDPDALGLVPRPHDVRITGNAVHAIDDDVRIHLVAGPAELALPPDIPQWQAAQAYRLRVTRGRCEILATGDSGIRHARRVIGQLRRVGEVPDLTIADRPAYEWRGLCVDIVRHFFGPRDLVSVMDIMAGLGLNRLHLHLSDDQGWRIDVPALPELVEKASGTSVGGGAGGHLSLADMEWLVAQAEARGIAVVPEIDIPGHTSAALHALPGLNPDGIAPAIHEGIDVGISTLSVAAPDTARFLDAVADTLAPWGEQGVHVGGDECLLAPPEEFAELVTMMVSRVHERGRRAIAWQEAAAQLHPGDLLQLWDERQDMSAVIEASRAGVGIIASPASKVYLDMKHDESQRLGLVWAGAIGLRDCYEWDPFTALPEVAPDAIVGVEACIFTETIETMEDLVHMLLPRLAAVAEVAWAGGGAGHWESFARRIAVRAGDWDGWAGVWYRSPQVEWDLPCPHH